MIWGRCIGLVVGLVCHGLSQFRVFVLERVCFDGVSGINVCVDFDLLFWRVCCCVRGRVVIGCGGTRLLSVRGGFVDEELVLLQRGGMSGNPGGLLSMTYNPSRKDAIGWVLWRSLVLM